MSKQYERFLQALRRDLANPLPGRMAQYQMAPRPRPGAEIDDKPRPDARQSGVLVLFYPHEDRIHLPLILRPTYQGVHSGQVAFPGGRYEEGDGDITNTALREAHEEVGVVPTEVQILGQLSQLYVLASNSLVYPTVAWSERRPNFLPDPSEVEMILEVPLTTLQDPQTLRTGRWTLRNRVADVPFFDIQEQTVWGATAMMLSELLALNSLQIENI